MRDRRLIPLPPRHSPGPQMSSTLVLALDGGAVVDCNMALLAVVGAVASLVATALVQNRVDCVDDHLTGDWIRLHVSQVRKTPR